jgi:hypothetical protein
MKIPSIRYVSAYTTENYNKMEIQRDGELTDADLKWNKCHGPRNYYVIKAILEYAQEYGLRSLSVLNMSGMNEGKPDPVLVDLLSPSFGRGQLSWSTIDHPESLTFTDSRIQEWVKEREITCIARDHRDETRPADLHSADVVLCTEIIEHLDYSDTIELMRSCWVALKPGGLLIVTTPNAVYLGHRVLFALGYWDFLHFNDDPAHVDQGLVGHTIYYDGKRITRLLKALNFINVRASTFNAGHGPGEYRNVLTRAAAISLRAISRIVPSSGQVLYVLAQRPL